MYDRMIHEVGWTRLQDMQREAENRRIWAKGPADRQTMKDVGHRIWLIVGLRFGWLPATFSDVA